MLPAQRPDILSESLSSSRVKALELVPEGVRLLDQNALPHAVAYLLIRSVDEMAEAITTMKVRGAPAIGIAGAYGMVLAAREYFACDMSLETLREKLYRDADCLDATRPTAVNLAWALNEMRHVASRSYVNAAALLDTLTEKARAIHEDDIASCRRIGEYGATLIPQGARILTHCNAGALATGGYGTALGVVRAAFAHDPAIRVYADETRPRFQGAKLTTWELLEDGIPVTLIADNMSGSLMRAGQVDVVIVGADRITANGDTANKIGTYNLAVLAKAHKIPFYVAAPLSTIDLSLKSGEAIPIEERDPAEIAMIHGKTICPEGTDFYNPAFDVTPADLITAIITNRGIARPNYTTSLSVLSRH